MQGAKCCPTMRAGCKCQHPIPRMANASNLLCRAIYCLLEDMRPRATTGADVRLELQSNAPAYHTPIGASEPSRALSSGPYAGRWIPFGALLGILSFIVWGAQEVAPTMRFRAVDPLPRVQSLTTRPPRFAPPQPGLVVKASKAPSYATVGEGDAGPLRIRKPRQPPPPRFKEDAGAQSSANRWPSLVGLYTWCIGTLLLWRLAPTMNARSCPLSPQKAIVGRAEPAIALMSAAGWADLHTPGDVVNQYEIVAKLGTGFSSTTYEARAPSGERVALKVMSLRGMDAGWKALELFEREVRVLRTLAHPGIPEYLDSFEVRTESNAAFYLVQRVADGQTVGQMVGEGWRPTEAQVLDVALQLLEILVYLSSLRPPVVHRDIKPENVMVALLPSGALRVSLVDFGGVVDSTKVSSFQSTTIGTFGYMAPEQFLGQASARSDIFAVGALTLFLLSGQPPSDFPQSRMRIRFRDRVTVTPAVATVIERMLEPVVEDRFQTPGEAAGALQDAQRGVSYVPSTPESVSGKPVGTAVRLSTSGNTFELQVPSSGIPSDAMASGSFTVAWTSIVALWTRTAILAGAPLLFTAASLPFWFTAVGLVRQTINGVRYGGGFFGMRIRMEPDLFTVSYVLFGRTLKTLTGETQRISSVEIARKDVVGDAPMQAVRIVEGENEYWIGQELEASEQKWMADAISEYLDTHR